MSNIVELNAMRQEPKTVSEILNEAWKQLPKVTEIVYFDFKNKEFLMKKTYDKSKK